MSKMRRGLAVSLCMLIAIASTITLTARAVSPATNFTDVPTDSWYAEPVAWAVALNITSGTSTTTFSPDDTCTNAQVLTFLWRANRCPDPRISNPFQDVSEGDYYYEAALWAYDCGMTIGNIFSPNAPCSRSLAVSYLWKRAGSPDFLPAFHFTDVSASSNYAQAVSWAIDMDITNGTSVSTFSPDDICTRAQIMTFIYRYMTGGNLLDFDNGNDTMDSNGLSIKS